MEADMNDIPAPEAPKQRGWPKGKPRGPKKMAADRSARASVRKAQQEYEALPSDDEDRLKVPSEVIPEGWSYQWVTDSVLGQPMPQRRARFERRGWRPVPAERHDGMFMPLGFKGEINVDGVVLMERPEEYTRQARKKDAMKAAEQVWVREAQMRGGDMPGVNFDTQHKSVVNKVSKAYERVPIPRDDD
jgi:hypothetical protein